MEDLKSHKSENLRAHDTYMLFIICYLLYMIHIKYKDTSLFYCFIKRHFISFDLRKEITYL